MKKYPLHYLFILVLSVNLAAGTADNGTFRFLTQSLPEGTTNAEYIGRFITANADGPVTFTALSALPDGLSLDPLSGFLSGIPTSTFNQTITVIADDSTQQIQFDVPLKINASGGGGNGGASFLNTSITPGRIGNIYFELLEITNGVGPFTYGAKDLPPGISLNGQTGILSGNPSAAGRYYVTLSAYDPGEGNYSATVLPVLVLPSGSEFQFITQSLNNGEVGTPYYDAYLVTNAAGAVSFAASGLPPGLILDSGTGTISGTPTMAGTFEAFISATDGRDTITSNLGMIITPSATSPFYWNVFSLPTGLLGVPYDRQPPITAAAVNGANVTYAVTGLPPGLNYNPTTGDLTGIPLEVGEFETFFVADDATTAEMLVFKFSFVILPPEGGDISSVPVNFWLTKQKLKIGEDGSESWKGLLQFNADRRTGARFDPMIDNMSISLGSRNMRFPAGALAGTSASMTFTTPSGQIPKEKVKLALSKERFQWASGNDSIAATVPGFHNVVYTMGSRSYRTSVHFDIKGGAKAFSSVRPAFVLTKGKLKVNQDGLDSAILGMLLSDANFIYQTGDTLRIRLLQDDTVLVDRDFTALGEGQELTDKKGNLSFKLKALKEADVPNRVSRFSYASAKGKLLLALSGLTLDALNNGEAHLNVELTIRDRTYRTGVTFFGSNPGSYSTSIR